MAMDRITVNPFTLVVKAKNFRILEPDGRAPFVSFDLLEANGDELAGLERLLAIDDLMQVEHLEEVLALARRQLPRLFPDRSG